MIVATFFTYFETNEENSCRILSLSNYSYVSVSLKNGPWTLPEKKLRTPCAQNCELFLDHVRNMYANMGSGIARTNFNENECTSPFSYSSSWSWQVNFFRTHPPYSRLCQVLVMWITWSRKPHNSCFIWLSESIDYYLWDYDQQKILKSSAIYC